MPALVLLLHVRVSFHDPVQRVFAVYDRVKLATLNQHRQELQFRCRHLADWTNMLAHVETLPGSSRQSSRQIRGQLSHSIEDYIERICASRQLGARVVDDLDGA